ncbi:hypothetical protein KUCAC02_010336, partial [Chaenocephalus aceratus]
EDHQQHTGQRLHNKRVVEADPLVVCDPPHHPRQKQKCSSATCVVCQELQGFIVKIRSIISCLFRCEGRPERVAGASETWHGDKGYSAQQTVSVSKPLGQMATVCQGDGPLPGSTHIHVLSEMTEQATVTDFDLLE